VKKIWIGLALGACLWAQTPAPAVNPADLRFPALREIKLPQIETYTMSNGMRVHLLENHELPLVSGVALVRTGNLFDPPDKVGLATITGMVLRTGGTRTRTGDQLDQDLENIAASVESAIGETDGQVSFSSLKENASTVLGIFRDVLVEPEFRQNRIALAKTQIGSMIARRNDEPEEIASREYTSILYGPKTPYGWQIEYSTLQAIGRDDLVAFYKRHFFPANIMLAVYGDFSAPEMKASLEKLFGGWTSAPPPAPPFPAVAAEARPGVFLARKDDVNQTVFFMGQMGGVRKDPNDPALQIMADILGGGFSSRLFRRVRTQLGFAYQIGASWASAYDHPGLFLISGSTKSSSTVDALQVVRQEVQRIRETEVTDQELKTSKDTVENSFVFNFDTPSKTLVRLLRYQYYGYPPDFIFARQKAIAAVTKADILRVARQYLKPEGFSVVTVGNPQEFGKPLSALGLPVQPIDLTIPPPKPAAAKEQ
jgi:zinc protease